MSKLNNPPEPTPDPIRQALEDLDAEEGALRAERLPALRSMEQQIAALDQQAANMRQQLQREAYQLDLQFSGLARAREVLRKLLPAAPEAVAESGQTAEKVV